MARTRDSGWIWITLAVLGAIVILPGMALRISGTLGGPGYALYDIPSLSMVPTIRRGDYVFALANVYKDQLPPRGQIVVFKYPPDGRTDYIKRVIGLPGDRVQLRGGRLFINDQLIPREPVAGADAGDAGDPSLHIYRETLPEGATYLIAETTDDGDLDNTPLFTVPAGDVFMLGDNRDRSSDSRVPNAVGYVPLALLRDKPLLVYWSKDLDRIGKQIH